DSQQQPVDPREPGDEVGGEAGGSGDVDGDALGGCFAELLAERVHGIAQVGVAEDRDERLHSSAVIRGDAGGDLVCDAIDVHGVGDGVIDGRQLVFIEFVVAHEDDDRGNR